MAAHSWEPNPRAARCAGRDLHSHPFTGHRRDFDAAAEHRLRDTDRHVEKDVLAFAAEELVRLDAHLHHDVLAHLSLARDAELFAVFKPGRDLDVDLAVADAQANGAADCRREEGNVRLDVDSFRRRLRSRAPATAAAVGE